MPSTRTGSYRWPGHCHGGYYAYNRDGSRSCVNQIGINSSNLPIYTVSSPHSHLIKNIFTAPTNFLSFPSWALKEYQLKVTVAVFEPADNTGNDSHLIIWIAQAKTPNYSAVESDLILQMIIFSSIYREFDCRAIMYWNMLKCTYSLCILVLFLLQPDHFSRCTTSSVESCRTSLRPATTVTASPPTLRRISSVRPSPVKSHDSRQRSAFSTFRSRLMDRLKFY